MGLLKIAAKAVGTVALTATGVTAHLANALASACGAETDIALFSTIQDASFETIRKMWNPQKYEEDIESGEADNRYYERIISSHSSGLIMVDKSMEQVQRMIEKAEQAGIDDSDDRMKGLKEKYADLQDKRDGILYNIAVMKEEQKENQLYH